MCGMYIINGVHGPELRSSGRNTSSNPQVSALIVRPAFNRTEMMCQRHGINQNSHPPVLVWKPLCNQFIHYYVSSRRYFGINRLKLCNIAGVAIECSLATVDRGGIMAYHILTMNFALCCEHCIASMAVWPVKWNDPFSPWPRLMSQLIGSTRMQSAVMEDFSIKLLAALELQQVVGMRFALIFEPLLKNHPDSIASKLNTTIQALNAKINTLEADSKAEDEKLAKMEQSIAHLASSIDDLEQYGRCDSVQFFGLP